MPLSFPYPDDHPLPQAIYDPALEADDAFPTDPYYPLFFERVDGTGAIRKNVRRVVKDLIFIAFHIPPYAKEMPCYDSWGPQTDDQRGSPIPRVLVTRDGPEFQSTQLRGSITVSHRFRILCEATDIEEVDAMEAAIMKELKLSGRLLDVLEQSTDEELLAAIQDQSHYSLMLVEFSAW